MVAKIEALPTEWAPGDNWAYRNTNYVLLGILIHKITGKPYYEFLDERIFKPLGMTDTTFYPSKSQIELLAKSGVVAGVQARYRGIGRPASRNRRFATSLSMATAEPRTPAPT